MCRHAVSALCERSKCVRRTRRPSDVASWGRANGGRPQWSAAWVGCGGKYWRNGLLERFPGLLRIRLCWNPPLLDTALSFSLSLSLHPPTYSDLPRPIATASDRGGQRGHTCTRLLDSSTLCRCECLVRKLVVRVPGWLCIANVRYAWLTPTRLPVRQSVGGAGETYRSLNGCS
jgi:hypothetical protein